MIKAAGPNGVLINNRGAAFPVGISERGDDREELLLILEGSAKALFEAPLTDLTLQYAATRGLVSQPGSAQQVARDAVRFYIGASPDLIQRRNFVRLVAAQRVVLDDGETKLLDGLTADISGGGMLVNCAPDTEFPGTLRFQLYVDKVQPPITGICHAVRTVGHNQRAVRFDEISGRDRQRLIHYIFDRQRAALRITRDR